MGTTTYRKQNGIENFVKKENRKMATDFHGQIFGENTDQISRELDLRPKHIGFKSSQMKFKGF